MIGVIALACVAAACQAQPPATGNPSTWPVPAGWGHETFGLPPTFAAELPYRGTEEIRFMPGWGKPGADDFWSYEFVWWLEQAPAFDPASLATALTGYFRGLSTAVAGSKYQFDPTRFRTVLEAVPGATDTRMTGQVFSYDAFQTGQPITLNVAIELRRCRGNRRTGLLFLLSPRTPGDGVWTDLRAAAAALECP